MGAAPFLPSPRAPEPGRGAGPSRRLGALAGALALLALAGCPRPKVAPPASPPAPASAPSPVPVQVAVPIPVPVAEPPARTLLFERLAALLTPPGGAGPAYGEAAAELERYLEKAPWEARRPELAALRALLAPRAPAPAPPEARIGELEAQLRELRATVERLGRENRELEAVVERLKELDVDMEQKRRRVR